MSSQKLKNAMEEIKFILDKHDIGASVVLATENQTEFFYKVTPTWSIITHNLETGEIRVTSKREDYDSDEDQIKSIEDSANLVFGLGVVNGVLVEHMSGITNIFNTRFDMQSELGEFEPHVGSVTTKELN